MRRRGRTDTNQRRIVKVLSEVGVSVAVTSNLGDGFPDIVCGYRRENYLFEIKRIMMREAVNDIKVLLTPDEKKFHDGWKGQVHVITNAQEALKIMGVIW